MCAANALQAWNEKVRLGHVPTADLDAYKPGWKDADTEAVTRAKLWVDFIKDARDMLYADTAAEFQRLWALLQQRWTPVMPKAVEYLATYWCTEEWIPLWAHHGRGRYHMDMDTTNLAEVSDACKCRYKHVTRVVYGSAILPSTLSICSLFLWHAQH